MNQENSGNTSFLVAFNKFGSWILFSSLFIFIVSKALTVPITHDEVASALYYSDFSFWEIVTLSNGDQNNHILNTILSKWSISSFGLKLWAVRLPSMLFFFIYSIAVLKLLDLLLPKNSKFYLAGALLFVLSPYLIDFFSLSRGYGMSVALTTLSTFYLVRGIVKRKVLSCYLAIIFAALVCFASFSSISCLCAIIVLVFCYIFLCEKRKLLHFLVFIFLVSLVAGAMYIPLSVISNAGQFSTWTNNGFIQDTLMSLVRLSLYGSKIFLTTSIISYFFIGVLMVGLIYSIVQFRRSIQEKVIEFNPNFIVLLLLFLTVFINVLQGWILHLPNLSGRIALFFYPLIVVGLIGCKPIFNWLNWKVKWVVVVVVLGLGIHHILTVSNRTNVLEWNYDAHTSQVLELVQSTSENRTVSLEMNWLFHPSLSFHQRVDGFNNVILGPYSKEINANSSADFYYCKEEDYALLEENYTIFAKFEDNWLLKHK